MELGHAALAKLFLLKPTPKFTLQKKDSLSASILLKTLNLLLLLNKTEIKYWTADQLKNIINNKAKKQQQNNTSAYISFFWCVFPTCSYVSYSHLNLVCWSGLALAINSERWISQPDMSQHFFANTVLLETYAVLLPFVRLNNSQRKDGMKAMGTEILLLFWHILENAINDIGTEESPACRFMSF